MPPIGNRQLLGDPQHMRQTLLCHLTHHMQHHLQ
jgi:hypothetical protein